MVWIARILCAVVALEHFYFCILECFLWNTPFGRRTFGTTPEFAAQLVNASAALADIHNF